MGDAAPPPQPECNGDVTAAAAAAARCSGGERRAGVAASTRTPRTPGAALLAQVGAAQRWCNGGLTAM